MAIFRYEAADVNGKLMRGAMEAATPAEVSQRLSQRGFLHVHVVGAAAAAATLNPSGSAARSVPTSFAGMPAIPRSGFSLSVAKPEDIALFFRQMASLVHAGFTVGAALSDLGPRTGNSGLRQAATEMGRETTAGSAMAPLMARYPGLFAEHMVGLVAAGETGGFVEFSFEEIALGAEQDAALRQGMFWPRILIWNAVWTVLLAQPLVWGLNPTKLMGGNVASVFAAFAGYERAMYWVIPLGISLHIANYFFGKIRHQPFAERIFDQLSLRFPVAARLARMRAMASFTRVLRRLLMSGVSPSPAFSGAAAAVANGVLRDQLRLGEPIVRGGQGLDEAIMATGLMGHDPLQMLVTGQKTGQWIEMLDQVTAYYQDEAARATDGAKAAQKRLGVLLTIIVNGYLICFSTWLGYKLMFQVTDSFAN